MAAETARRLACDASIVNLIEDDDGEPLNVGRKTRTISAPLRRLLNARDKGCRFPGCCNARYMDIHHIEHWANGGETKPSNLVSLCRFHHRAVHEGGIRIEILDDGALRFVKANGSAVGRRRAWLFAAEEVNWRELPAANRAVALSRGPHGPSAGRGCDDSAVAEGKEGRSAGNVRIRLILKRELRAQQRRLKPGWIGDEKELSTIWEATAVPTENGERQKTFEDRWYFRQQNLHTPK